jgi:hypothetical protein
VHPVTPEMEVLLTRWRVRLLRREVSKRRYRVGFDLRLAFSLEAETKVAASGVSAASLPNP